MHLLSSPGRYSTLNPVPLLSAWACAAASVSWSLTARFLPCSMTAHLSGVCQRLSSLQSGSCASGVSSSSAKVAIASMSLSPAFVISNRGSNHETVCTGCAGYPRSVCDLRKLKSFSIMTISARCGSSPFCRSNHAYAATCLYQSS